MICFVLLHFIILLRILQKTTWLVALGMSPTSHRWLPLSILPQKLSSCSWHLHILTWISMLNTLTPFSIIFFLFYLLSTFNPCKCEFQLRVNLAEISYSLCFYSNFSLFGWVILILFDDDKTSEILMIIGLTPVDIILILLLAFRYKFPILFLWTLIIV